MKLFVDDLRDCPEGWQIARNVSAAIGWLSRGVVDEISLDHDIACKHPGCYVDCQLEDFTAVAEYVALMNPRPVVRIHTGNVVAGRKMADILGIQYNNEIYAPENFK
jgi:hypothetical protein